MRHLLLLCVVACSHSQPAKPAAPAPVAKSEPEPFDMRVRDDFFNGLLHNDTAALDRAMKLCEDTLAKNPKHAEAMVWHGAGVVGHSSLAFRAGDRDKGIELYTKGLAEMDQAVTLEPDNVGVRIPRGAVVLAMAPFVPEPEKSKLLERGVADYEKTYALQQGKFDGLTLHSREQLLYGLVDGYANMKQLDKAVETFGRMQKQAKGSELLARAEKRSRGEAVDGPTPCEQCHSR